MLTDETGCELAREACGHYVGECECDELSALDFDDLDLLARVGLVSVAGAAGDLTSYKLTPAGRALLKNSLDSKKLLAR